MPNSFITSVAGRAQAEAMQSDDFSVEADVLIPNLGHAGLDRNASATFVRQNFFAIFFRLAIEPFEAGHRNDAHAVAQFLRRRERVLQFAPARQNNEIEFSRFSFWRCNRRASTPSRRSFTSISFNIGTV